MLDEGYIKFQLFWDKLPVPEEIVPKDLMRVRDVLHAKGLIGEYADVKIGYGNASVRLPGNSFVITASMTGHIPAIEPSHFAVVDRVSVMENSVYCHGLMPASSESMTHAMVYASHAQVNSVLHIHSALLWNKWLHKAPTTPASIAYGTVEMALAVKKICSEIAAPRGLLAMAGHQDGLVAFGTDPDDALNQIILAF